jgi:hypothetical protein
MTGCYEQGKEPSGSAERLPAPQEGLCSVTLLSSHIAQDENVQNFVQLFSPLLEETLLQPLLENSKNP